jgi:hypothetical protein
MNHLAFISILLFTCLSLKGQSHSGRLLIYDFPLTESVIVIARSGDTISPEIYRGNNYAEFRWAWSSKCVDFWPTSFGPYRYELYYKGVHLMSDNLRYATSTCLKGSEQDNEIEYCQDRVYPNPTTGKVFSHCGGRYQVFNSAGKKVATVKGKEFDFSFLPDGAYWLMKWNDKRLIIKNRLLSPK